MFASLFVNWHAAAGVGNVLALFGAVKGFGRFLAAANQNAWEAYSVAGGLLMVLAAAMLIAAFLKRRDLRVFVGVATLAAPTVAPAANHNP